MKSDFKKKLIKEEKNREEEKRERLSLSLHPSLLFSSWEENCEERHTSAASPLPLFFPSPHTHAHVRGRRRSSSSSPSSIFSFYFLLPSKSSSSMYLSLVTEKIPSRGEVQGEKRFLLSTRTSERVGGGRYPLHSFLPSLPPSLPPSPFPSSYTYAIIHMIRVKLWSLNAHVSNKFLLKSSNLIFKLEHWRVKVESTGRKVKRLKSEDNFFGILRFRKRKWSMKGRRCTRE